MYHNSLLSLKRLCDHLKSQYTTQGLGSEELLTRSRWFVRVGACPFLDVTRVCPLPILTCASCEAVSYLIFRSKCASMGMLYRKRLVWTSEVCQTFVNYEVLEGSLEEGAHA